MARNHGSKTDGGKWSDTELRNVWNKGTEISGKDKAEFRKDKCGATMQFSKHGDIKHANGWEVDHIKPVAKGGGDELSNLQPLHWENNRAKGDGDLVCKVKS